MEKKLVSLEFMENWAIFQINRKFLYAPAAIVEDSDLSAQARILFIIINSFSKNFGYCFAGNEILCKKVGLKKTMVKIYLKELIEKEIINVKIEPKGKYPRKIYINFPGLMKRYPKLPVAIPPRAKVSANASRILSKK